jgi:hypothetical protein
VFEGIVDLHANVAISYEVPLGHYWHIVKFTTIYGG